MSETIFSKIIRGELPCHKVYEDAHVLSFLDISPLSRGHVLLIPKREVATVDLLSDDESAAIGRALPRLCRAMLAATGARAFHILQKNGVEAGQEVPHVHFHLIPTHEDRTGLHFEWKPTTFDHTEGKQLAKAMADAL